MTPCINCGNRTTAANGVCRTCRRNPRWHDQELGLKWGAWRPTGRGTVVWIPNPDAPRPSEAEPVRIAAECGTESGYKKHQRQRTRACNECKRAKADAERVRSARRAAA
jgi:hypothetical protein